MAAKVSVKTTFEPAKVIEPLYTGGDVSLDSDGRFLATCVEEDVLIFDIETGERSARVEGDGEPITSLSLSPTSSHVVVCSRSLAMRIYSLEQNGPQLQRTLKPHSTPVVTSAIDSTGALLATGGADAAIKVWDIRGGYVTHNFHGHGGVVTALSFFQRPSVNSEDKSNRIRGTPLDYFLASGSEDGKIRVWNLHTRKSIVSLDSHVSVVKSLALSQDGRTLLSASRDRTIILWDATSWKARKVIPALEVLEAAGFCPKQEYCYSGGENGRLRVWSIQTGKEVTREQAVGIESEAIVNIQCGPNFLLSVHVDQRIEIHDVGVLESVTPGKTLAPLPVRRRISASNDEIIDLALAGPDRSLLALATNTESIRLLSIAEPVDGGSRHFGADVAHLAGHSDIIICLDVDWSGHWLATGAKDNTARIWQLDPSNSSYVRFATFEGHTESLGAVALPRVPPAPQAIPTPLDHAPTFLLTGSQDKTIKKWDISRLNTSLTDFPHSVTKSSFTRVAHEKDINALDVSYNAAIFASASQDRSIKIWDLESGSVLGILRGHKRGVWSIRFAPRDIPVVNTDTGNSSKGLLASGSGDCAVKLWSLATYTCIMTFEGHSNSVLKVLWLSPVSQPEEGLDETSSNRRLQKSHPIVVSSSSDSLIKLWSPYSPSSTSSASTISLADSHLLTTLDNHIDRVWALATPTTALSPITPTRKNDEKYATDHQITAAVQNLCAQYPLISGSADSTLTFWSETTSDTLAAARMAAEERVEQDQQLENHMRAQNYREVIVLALQLDHPGRLLAVLEQVIGENTEKDESEERETSITGSRDVDDVLRHLSRQQLYALLIRLRDWNTNARTAPVTQRILNLILRAYPTDTFLEMEKSQKRITRLNSNAQTGSTFTDAVLPTHHHPVTSISTTGSSSNSNRDKAKPSITDIFRALEVYTDRHLRRTEDLIDESHLLDYTLGCMDEVIGANGGVELDGMGMDIDPDADADARNAPALDATRRMKPSGKDFSNNGYVEATDFSKTGPAGSVDRDHEGENDDIMMLD